MALQRTALTRKGSKNDSSKDDEEIDNNGYIQVLVKPLERGNLCNVLANLFGIANSNLSDSVSIFYGIAFLILGIVVYQICDMGIFFQRTCSVFVPMFTVINLFYWMAMHLRKSWSTTSVYLFFGACFVGETFAQLVFGQWRGDPGSDDGGYLSRPAILFIVLLSICIASLFSSLETTNSAIVISLVSFSRYLLCSSMAVVPYGLRPYTAYMCGLGGFIVSKYMEMILKPPINNFMTHDGKIPVIKRRRSSSSTAHAFSSHRSARRTSLPALIPKNQVCIFVCSR